MNDEKRTKEVLDELQKNAELLRSIRKNNIDVVHISENMRSMFSELHPDLVIREVKVIGVEYEVRVADPNAQI